MKYVIVLLSIVILSGCGRGIVVKSNGLPPVVVDTLLCIQNNPKVIVTDMDRILMDLVKENGYEVQLYFGSSRPAECHYVLVYVAGRRWMLVDIPMIYAKLDLYRGRDLLGSGTFGNRRHGMLVGDRWKGTEDNLRPLVSELLKGNL